MAAKQTRTFYQIVRDDETDEWLDAAKVAIAGTTGAQYVTTSDAVRAALKFLALFGEQVTEQHPNWAGTQLPTDVTKR